MSNMVVVGNITSQFLCRFLLSPSGFPQTARFRAVLCPVLTVYHSIGLRMMMMMIMWMSLSVCGGGNGISKVISLREDAVM